MKKLITITTALIIGTSIVSAQSVTSGIFGVSKVTIPPAGGVNLVGYNFTSDETIYLEDVFGTGQLVQNARSRYASRVFLWNGNGYDSYYQEPDGLFYNTNNSSTPVSVEITTGTAMFVVSPGNSSAASDIIFSGSVLDDNSVSQSYALNVSLFASPYPTAMDLNDVSFDWSGATANNRSRYADLVYIWNTVTEEYDSFYLDGSRVWQVLNSSVSEPIVSAGGGMFFKSKAAFSNVITKNF